MAYEYRGKDYPCFYKSIKMSIAMPKKERRKWFSEKVIKKWKKENPKGEYRGSF